MDIIDIKDYKNNRFKRFKTFKRLVYILFFMFFVFYFATNYKAYTKASLNRTFSYIALANSSNKLLSDLEIKASATTKIEAFNSGIVMCDKDVLTYLNPAGKIDTEIQLSYETPDMTVGNNHVITYERNGYKYLVSNSFGTLYDSELNSAILNITANDNDDFIFITDEKGYVSAVTMINKEGEEVFKWATSTYTTITAKANNSGSQVAALCVYAEENEFKSKVIIFNTKKGDIIKEYTFENSFPIDITFLNGSNIGVIFDDGIKVLNERNIVKEIQNTLINAYNINNPHNIVYAYSSSNILTDVYVLDTNGNEIAKRTFDFQVKGYETIGNDIYILTPTSLKKFDIYLNLIKEIEPPVGINSILTHKNGAIYGVYSNKIIKLF